MLGQADALIYPMHTGCTGGDGQSMYLVHSLAKNRKDMVAAV
jgi:RNase adaptor protein for sRNA GlmZ degradation